MSGLLIVAKTVGVVEGGEWVEGGVVILYKVICNWLTIKVTWNILV